MANWSGDLALLLSAPQSPLLHAGAVRGVTPIRSSSASRCTWLRSAGSARLRLLHPAPGGADAAIELYVGDQALFQAPLREGLLHACVLPVLPCAAGGRASSGSVLALWLDGSTGQVRQGSCHCNALI